HHHRAADHHDVRPLAVELRPGHDNTPSDHHDVRPLAMELRPGHYHGPPDHHGRAYDNIGPAHHNHRTPDHPTEQVLLVADLVLTVGN
ncbi:hypothetical protein, partial [Nocardia tengchongensis]